LKTLITALRVLALMMILTGVVYPLLIAGLATAFLPRNAAGNLVTVAGRVIGSRLIGQQFTDPRYFWPRPSAVGYNPLPSGGSNLSPTSASLQAQIADRKAQLAKVTGSNRIPADLYLASGSGLDPDISLEAALYEVHSVARARGLDSSLSAAAVRMVYDHTIPRTLGFLGEPRVNVLLLNLALDSLDSSGHR